MQASAASNNSAKVSCAGLLEDLRSTGLFEGLPAVSDLEIMVITAAAASEACSFITILATSGTSSTGHSRFRICKKKQVYTRQANMLVEIIAGYRAFVYMF